MFTYIAQVTMSRRRGSYLKLLSLMVISFTNLSHRAHGGYYCSDMGNYTTNSTYGANLRAVLSALASNASKYGFYSATVGRGQDTAHAVVQCRVGDVQLRDCGPCVVNATAELLQLCPNQVEALMWYSGGLCTLRFSNQTMAWSGRTYSIINGQDVADPDMFQQVLRKLLDILRPLAANGSSAIKTSAGSMSSGLDRVEVMLQCFPTMSAFDCDYCLGRLSLLRRYRRGGRLLIRSSCNIRYEVYPFLDQTRLWELNVSYINVPGSPPPAPNVSNTMQPGTRSTNNNVIKILVPFLVVVCTILLACAAVFVKRRRQKNLVKKLLLPPVQENGEGISTVESLQYPFQQIRIATNDFSETNMLGRGGFGAVYQGELSNGKEIAVKRLSKESGQGNTEFKNEVLLLTKLQHRNLVRLLGFSSERRERLLIYEFVPNSSLDHFIFDSVKSSQLDWEIRFKIIAGTARGLLYLHEDSRLRIIHRDLKPSNILLDGEMNPKVADFGMARLFGQNDIQGSTSKIAGTYGYMSPEYAKYGQFSVKSDVFSFGAIVLEIISGQKIFTRKGDSVQDLLTIVWKNWCGGTIESVVDPAISAERGLAHDVLRCIHIGLLCVQENPDDRPTISSVLLMLSSSAINLAAPSRPSFMLVSRFGPNIPVIEEPSSKECSEFNLGSKGGGNMTEASYGNDSMITELHPR